MKPAVIILNGNPRSGKDTLVNILRDEFGERICLHSTVDKVKLWAKEMGWDGEKTPHMRNMLSDLKDLYTKYFDGPFKDMQKCIEETNQNYVVFMIREPQEIEKMVDWCRTNNINVLTVAIDRPLGIDEGVNNTGDNNVWDYRYNVVVVNAGTMAEFRKTVMDFYIHHIIPLRRIQ